MTHPPLPIHSGSLTLCIKMLARCRDAAKFAIWTVPTPTPKCSCRFFLRNISEGTLDPSSEITFFL